MHALFHVLLPASLFFAAPAGAPADSAKDKRGDRPSMMERHDADGSGTLSAAEVAGTRFESRFATVDADSDGEVTRTEMKAARKGKRGKDRRMRSERRSDRASSKGHDGECGDKADRRGKGKRGKGKDKAKRSAKRGPRSAA